MELRDNERHAYIWHRLYYIMHLCIVRSTQMTLYTTNILNIQSFSDMNDHRFQVDFTNNVCHA